MWIKVLSYGKVHIVLLIIVFRISETTLNCDQVLYKYIVCVCMCVRTHKNCSSNIVS